jgi:hypothetical protein
MNGWKVGQLNRRGLLLMAAAAGATVATPRLLRAAAGKGGEPRFGGDLTAVRAAIETQRPQAIKRLQDWIALPSIAAEDRNMKEGCQMMIDLLKDAGFQSATMMPTDG